MVGFEWLTSYPIFLEEDLAVARLLRGTVTRLGVLPSRRRSIVTAHLLTRVRSRRR